MKKIILTALGAAVFAVSCTSYGATPAGVVIDRERRAVTVRQGDGTTVTHRTSKSVARRCSPGERWPVCA